MEEVIHETRFTHAKLTLDARIFLCKVDDTLSLELRTTRADTGAEIGRRLTSRVEGRDMPAMHAALDKLIKRIKKGIIP